LTWNRKTWKEILEKFKFSEPTLTRHIRELQKRNLLHRDVNKEGKIRYFVIPRSITKDSLIFSIVQYNISLAKELKKLQIDKGINEKRMLQFLISAKKKGK